jgi:ATP-dependent Clp protease ATP-binding subunit ClpC
MFERYTEKARRIIFFARYEASQFGSPYIDTEHLLLGLMREDKALTHRFLPKTASAEAIRSKIENATVKREKVATSVDLPLSNECKRVLAYAAEEAERLSNHHIGSEHLMLGLMREEKSFAAQLLDECGLKLENVRAELAQNPVGSGAAERPEMASLLSPVRSDLTELAVARRLNAFVGRDNEMERLIHVLGRATKNSAVLVGDPGVGKRAMVEGLAQRIAEGKVATFLAERKVLDFDVIQIGGPKRAQAMELLLMNGGAVVFYLEELIPVLASASPVNLPQAAEALKTLLLGRKIQCICSATLEDYRSARKQHGWLDRCFRVIQVPAMTEAETVAILVSAKPRLESFHFVTVDEDVIAAAVHYANLFVKDRALPDKALDLIDEAAAYAKIHQQSGIPDEIWEVRKRIRFIVERMENAIANHEFEKARFYSDEERKERAGLLALEKKYKIEKNAIQLTRADVEEVLSRWTGVSISVIQECSAAAGGDSPKQ